jgi:hypothetical protein
MNMRFGTERSSISNYFRSYTSLNCRRSIKIEITDLKYYDKVSERVLVRLRSRVDSSGFGERLVLHLWGNL